MSVREALATFFGETQSHRAYPVVRGGAVIGMVDRAMLERGRRFGASGDALRRVVAPCRRCLPGETCRLVATRLAVHGLERLPVVADGETLRLVGIVSRSDLVKPSLAHFDEEHKHERFRRIGRGGGSAFAKRRRVGSR